MKQQITDESTGISYTLQGDYYIPNLVLPEDEGTSYGRNTNARGKPISRLSGSVENFV